MNALEFEARKAALARAILNTESGEIINEVKDRLRSAEAEAFAGRELTEEDTDKLIDAMI